MQGQSVDKLALFKSLFKSNKVFLGDARSQFFTQSLPIKAEASLVQNFNNIVGWKNHKILPPTWLQVAAMPLYLQIITAKTFPFSPLGLVHVENCVRLIKPLPVNEQYELTCYADNVREHRKGQLFDLIVQARIAEELVYESVASNLAFLKKSIEPEVVNKPGRDNACQLHNEIALLICPSDIGRHYAAVSGDYNLIHLASLPAKLFGFKRHIAHGMYLKARALSALQADANLEQENIEAVIKFIKPVFLPGEVTMFAAADPHLREFSLESANRKIIHCKGSIQRLNVSR